MTRGRTVAKSAVLLGAAVAAFFVVQSALPRRTLTGDARKDAEKDIFRNGVPLEVVRARGWPGLREWEEAVAKFPTLDSCLVSTGERDEPLTIDWGRISSDIEANVCLSRVASKIGSLEEVASWFNRQGFRVSNIQAVPETQTAPESKERSGNAVEAVWPVQTNGPLYKGGILIFLLQRFNYIHGISCVVFFGERRTVISTSCASGVL